MSKLSVGAQKYLNTLGKLNRPGQAVEPSNDLLSKLMAPVPKVIGKNKAHFRNVEPGAVQQADLLKLPTDADGALGHLW